MSAAERPESIGPYRTVRELGRGGQGVVYLAEDPRLRRRVAVKILSGSTASCEEGLERFHREAEAASRLHHPGICTVYDVGSAEGESWIAMRYVEGSSLHERIRDVSSGSSDSTFHLEGDSVSEAVTEIEAPVSTGPSTRDEILETVRLVEKVARALHAAHEAHIVHRDIKPGNIMVGIDGEPVIMDFGLAHLEDPDLPALTRSGDLFGTPAYMSPEQLTQPLDRLDRRTDVWSLGVTLFECLTMRRPFEAATRQGLFQEITRRDPPDPRSLNARVPQELRWVLETALEKNPDRRYRTALEFAEDLRRVRSFEPIRARPVTWWIRFQRWVQRNPALSASLGTIVLLVLSALVGSLVLLAQREAALEEKTSALDRYEQMSDAALVSDLVTRARKLWPRRPSLVAAMDRWIAEAMAVRGRLSDHETALRELRARAAPYDAAQEEADASHRRELYADLFDQISARRQEATDAETELTVLRQQLEALTARIAERPSDRLERRHQELVREETRAESTLRRHRGALQKLEADPRLRERLSWELAHPTDRWRHQVLTDLVRELAGLVPLIEEIEARRDFAASIADRSVENHRAAWERCLSEIGHDPAHAACIELRDLQPQVGLVSLGIDRDSGLWEFWHLDSGAKPTWEGEPWAKTPEDDPRGKAVVGETSGIVLVLLPGGTFSMGATREEGTSHHDPRALTVESPVHQVTLGAFFMAKHEVTQAQWAFFGADPSTYGRGGSNYVGGEITGLHPVTNVDWGQARDAMWRWDLALPTEAQWEYACRAGTQTIYWCGDSVESIQAARAGNVSDFTASRATPKWTCTLEIDDGHLVHAPIGSFEPNPFGLHDVLGNVMEWCQDRYGRYDEPTRSGDGLRDPAGASARVYRGGGFYRTAEDARSAKRTSNDPSLRYGDLGIRPARAISR